MRYVTFPSIVNNKFFFIAKRLGKVQPREMQVLGPKYNKKKESKAENYLSMI